MGYVQAALVSVSVWLQIRVECAATEVLLVLHHHSPFQAQLEMMVMKKVNKKLLNSSNKTGCCSLIQCGG